MGYSLSQNLIFSQPPLFLFTVCLTAFGLTMVILAYIIGACDFPNPDSSLDWNKLFKQLTKFKLCPLSASNRTLPNKTPSEHATDSLLNVSSSIVDQSQSLSAALSNVGHHSAEELLGDVRYTEVSVLVQFKILSISQLVNFFHVNGKVKGSLLGFSGKYDHLPFNLSLDFSRKSNTSCSDITCKSLWDACLRISIPSDFLLKIKLPESCIGQADLLSSHPPTYSLENQDSLASSSHCILLDYVVNPKLTEMLSLQDRSVINLHLMHTSCFMFVMVMTLICYSLIKGKNRPSRKFHSYEKGLLNT